MNPDPNQPQEPTQEAAPDSTPAPIESQASPDVSPSSESATSYAAAPASPVESVETPTEVPVSNSLGNTINAAAATPAEAPAEAPVDTAAPNPFGPAPTNADPLASTPLVPPTGTIGSAPEGDVPASPEKKSKKKLIVLISIIVGALIVLGGAAVAIYLMFFAVTKADYQKAYDQVSTVRDKYSTGDSITSNSSKETVDAAKTAYADFKTENAKLVDLKALKSDKDLKAKYDAYAAKAKDYIAFGDAFIPSLDRFVTAADQVTALGTGASAFTSTNIQKTIDIYKGIDDIADPTLKSFVDSTIAAYEEILPQAKIYESTTSTSAQKYAAISAISNSGDKISTAANKMSDELNAKVKAVSLDDTLNDLGKAVTAKLNAAK